MPQVLSVLAAGSLPNSGAMASLLLLLGRDVVTTVIGYAHDPAAVHLLITLFISFDFYVYL